VTQPFDFSPERRELLRRLLGSHSAGVFRDRIGRRQVAHPVCASFAQERLWFLHQLDRESPAYNVLFPFHVSGPLDAPALERALTGIVRRHEVLRTTFTEVDGSPVQCVHAPADFKLPIGDLQGLPASSQEVEVQRITRLEQQRPFDLARGPVFEGRLLRLGPREHVLILRVHHIAFDGWSTGILFRELALLYGALCAGRQSLLSELPVQYGDFAVWQRERMTGEATAPMRRYWKQQLEGAPNLLTLPTDRLRSARQDFRGGEHAFRIRGPVVDSLETLGRRCRATMFMTLLAAFQTLLFRYSGQGDLVVGTPIAGRRAVELEGLIGFFVNTLPLRVQLDQDLPFVELLARTRATALDGFANQDLPFERIVQEIQPARTLSFAPLVQVVFAYQNVDVERLELPGLAVKSQPFPHQAAKFDLMLSVAPCSGELAGSLGFSRQLFDQVTVERMATHFERLLEEIVKDPQKRLVDYSILTPAERQEIVIEQGATASNFPRDRGIHELFEAQVHMRPDAIAISGPPVDITYGELNRRANKLARYLRACGADPGDIIGLCLERSADLIAAMVAILKAGCAYLPLDPTQPADRLSLMLEDARASLVVTRHEFAARVPADPAKLVCLDIDNQRIVRQSEVNLGDPLDADSFNAERLAYVIYTSGSTGRPKGVAVPHRAVNRLVINTNYIAIRPDDFIAQTSNASFDAATFEIWGALLHGARLGFVDRDTALSPRALAQAISGRGFTTMFVTTALFNHVASEEPSAFRPLRHLLFGGEAVEPRWVREVLRVAPPARLLHVYGPTEATTFASWHEVHDVPEECATIPIGKPISNTSLYVLDDRLAPVPIGVVGEICIGGPGLARGYLHDDDLTAARFVAGPFVDEPRLYRTGDLGRYLPDGDIEFVGRRDGQVKLRGFRVELAEIETVLARHPLVLRAVVLMAGDITRDRHLVAYVVPTERADSLETLRPYLQQKLPDYMIPAELVAVESIPLTSNGKVDRARLTALKAECPVGGSLLEKPTDFLEVQLVSIWEAVLGVRPIGLNENFFALGGHSLLAARLFGELEKAFGIRLPLVALFQAATIAELARLIRAKGWSPQWASLVPMQSRGSRPPLFLVHGIGGNILCYRDLAHLLGADQPVYGLQAVGLDGTQPPHTTIEEMAVHYVALVRQLRPEGPYHLAGLSFGGIVAFEMAQQFRRLGDKVGLVALLDTSGPQPARTDRTKLERYDALARFFVRRASSHVVRMLMRPNRFDYFRRTSRTMRGKLAGRLWQVGALPYRTATWPLPKTLWRVKEASRQALREYRAEIYSGRLTLFRAITHSQESFYGKDLGWRRVAVGGLEIVDVPGDHLSILEHPNVEVLAEMFRAGLEQTEESSVTRVETCSS